MERIGGETLIECEACHAYIRIRRTDLRYARVTAGSGPGTDRPNLRLL